jgi:hypothetical protein
MTAEEWQDEFARAVEQGYPCGVPLAEVIDRYIDGEEIDSTLIAYSILSHWVLTGCPVDLPMRTIVVYVPPSREGKVHVYEDLLDFTYRAAWRKVADDIEAIEAATKAEPGELLHQVISVPPSP